MMKKTFIILIASLTLFLGMVVVTLFSGNQFGDPVLKEIKAMGYLPYSPSEATKLAYTRCTTCHNEEKVVKYCTRCGPPFIVIVHIMKRHIMLAQKQGKNIRQLSDAEAVAIVQVWNALVGNWDHTWRRQDLELMLKGNDALLALLDTPPEQRPIEAALMGKHAPGAYREEYSTSFERSQ